MRNRRPKESIHRPSPPWAQRRLAAARAQESVPAGDSSRDVGISLGAGRTNRPGEPAETPALSWGGERSGGGRASGLPRVTARPSAFPEASVRRCADGAGPGPVQGRGGARGDTETPGTGPPSPRRLGAPGRCEGASSGSGCHAPPAEARKRRVRRERPSSRPGSPAEPPLPARFCSQPPARLRRSRTWRRRRRGGGERGGRLVSGFPTRPPSVFLRPPAKMALPSRRRRLALAMGTQCACARHEAAECACAAGACGAAE